MINFISAFRQSFCLAARLPNSGKPSFHNICSERNALQAWLEFVYEKIGVEKKIFRTVKWKLQILQI